MLRLVAPGLVDAAWTARFATHRSVKALVVEVLLFFSDVEISPYIVFAGEETVVVQADARPPALVESHTGTHRLLCADIRLLVARFAHLHKSVGRQHIEQFIEDGFARFVGFESIRRTVPLSPSTDETGL